ncbi:transcription factor IIIC, partial [Striga asiatica]
FPRRPRLERGKAAKRVEQSLRRRASAVRHRRRLRYRRLRQKSRRVERRQATVQIHHSADPVLPERRSQIHRPAQPELHAVFVCDSNFAYEEDPRGRNSCSCRVFPFSPDLFLC